MKAMIFAAGLGTRLYPITLHKPKALIEVQGKPLLMHAIEKLQNSGIEEIIINIHHFPDQIINFIESNSFQIPIQISDERDILLDTGGGLKNAGSFLKKETFLLYNVDILSDINLSELILFHQKNKPLATLVVRNRVTKRYLLFDKNNILGGWENIESGEQILIKKKKRADLKPYAFSGIHILDPDIFKLMPDKKIFSMIELYLKLGGSNKICAFIDTKSNWIDVGKIEQLKKLN
ncbi:MAG: NTP transferase domain-containing protein [Bacteroidetes bacterium]|nr:NTP transferase domain-containing protein [Bacteroidota bacterium]